MRVLFLDFDGVLNSDPYLRDCGWFDKRTEPDADQYMLCQQRVELLNRILRDTDARIVFSTSWRTEHDDETSARLLVARGFAFPERVVGHTPRAPVADRVNQIRRWLRLRDWPDVESFVILEDAEPMFDLEPRTVRTDDQVGLTVELAQRAIELLRR